MKQRYSCWSSYLLCAWLVPHLLYYLSQTPPCDSRTTIATQLNYTAISLSSVRYSLERKRELQGVGRGMCTQYYKQPVDYNLATIQFEAPGYCLPHLIYQHPYAKDGAKHHQPTSSHSEISSSSREAIGNIGSLRRERETEFGWYINLIPTTFMFVSCSMLTCSCRLGLAPSS